MFFLPPWVQIKLKQIKQQQQQKISAETDAPSILGNLLTDKECAYAPGKDR